MKIVFIGQKGIPAKSGGVERHAEELSIRLAKAGHSVIVYTRPNYVGKRLKKYRGVKLVSLPCIPTKNLEAISHTLLACLDVIFRRKADIIHFHSIGPSSLIWLVKIFKPRTPVVMTFHTQCYYHKKWGRLAKAYLKFGEYIGHKLSDEIVAISRTLQEFSLSKYNRSVLYIPNGATIPKLIAPDKIKKKWGLKKDSYILAASRLVEHKGLHYLIEAYKKLNTKKKLVIAGAGSYTESYVRQLKKLAKNDKDRIIFTGSLNGEYLKEIFSNAYVFVQPSETEGLSLALLEAMAYKKMVLVSDIKENLEAIGAAGMAFKNKQAEDLAEKLQFIIDNPKEIKKFKEASRVRVKEEYNWDNIGIEVDKLYSRFSNRKRNFAVKLFKYLKLAGT